MSTTTTTVDAMLAKLGGLLALETGVETLVVDAQAWLGS